MELVVAADSYFYKTPNGEYWCKTIYDYNFWQRYLGEFEKVAIVSRTMNVEHQFVKDFLRVDGPNIRIIELPPMRGMKQYILSYIKFNKAAKAAVSEAECALFRLPSVSATLVSKHYIKRKKPYALEVVVDPFDAYSFNKLAQIIFTKQLRKITLMANGVSYVTKSYLQSKYPSHSRIYGESKKYFESYYSSINLNETFFSQPKKFSTGNKKYTIIHTANNMNNYVKGHDTVIKILKELHYRGANVNAVFIGEGEKREEFEQLAKELGISNKVKFTGLLSSSDQVRNELVKSDIFVFPTKAEGLPRAIIEAMAVGLPCLSTPVNGIPELLNNEYLFDPCDVNGFTDKLISLMNEPKILEKMSAENIGKAKEYSADKLTIRRNDFYKKLRELVEDFY